MNLSKKLTLVSLLFFCLHSVHLQAQRSLRFTDKHIRLKQAAQFADLQDYQQAYFLLDEYLTHFRQEPESVQEIDYQTALYLYHKCALRMNQSGAEEKFVQFLSATPYNQLKQFGEYELGQYYYDHNRFDAAIKSYERVGIGMLTNKELIKRNFELGYSYLVTQQLNKVEPYFQSAKNIPGEYFTPGNYYHGLLSYYKKNYAEAKSSFLAVKDDERYKKIVPYYLTEIEYVNGDKEKALNQALAYLKSPDQLYYEDELNRMVAQIYCEQEDYANAEKYYAQYIAKAKQAGDEEYFKLGYCQYQQAKISEAIPNLEEVAISEHEVSQHSAYLLGLCYLKNGDKVKAFDVFQRSKPFISDPTRKELIDFTCAKLSYEKGDDQTAIANLTSFARQFPQSEYVDEVNELLAFLNIKYDNFNDAVIAMNKLKNISYNLKRVYQKANYARGIQLLKDENPDRAIFHFKETGKFPVDENIVLLSDFWLTECHYRLGHYSEALQSSNFFLDHADTVAMPDYTQKIHLTKSYIYYHVNDTANLFIEYPLASGDTNVTDLLARMGSMKANFIPEKIPVVENDPYVIVYNLPDEKLDFVYKPIPLKPLAMNTEIKREDQTNYARLSVGNLTSVDYGIGYNFDDLINMPLYVDFTHSGTKGKIAYQQVNQTHVGLRTNTQYEAHSIDLALNIDRNKQSYYGFDHVLYNFDNVDIKQIFRNVGLNAKVKPLTAHEINYDATLYAGVYSDKFHASETSLKADIPVSMQLKEDLFAQSDVLFDANLYNVRNYNTQWNSILSWRPALTKQINDVKIKAGLYPTFGQTFSLLPDISVQYPLKSISSVIELAWQSNIRLNTFKQMTELNPFIFNHYKVRQSRNTELFAGINGMYKHNFSYAFRAGVAVYENLPLFLNDTSGDFKQFTILYESKATALLMDAAVDYTLNSEVFAGAKLKFRPLLHQTDYKEIWHYIPTTFELYGALRATKDVMLKANVFLQSGSKAIGKSASVNGTYTAILNPGFDMNLNVRYSINRKWNALIDLNNLFGSNYQRWYGYPMYGTNVMVGVIHSFNSLKAKP